MKLQVVLGAEAQLATLLNCITYTKNFTSTLWCSRKAMSIIHRVSMTFIVKHHAWLAEYASQSSIGEKPRPQLGTLIPNGTEGLVQRPHENLQEWIINVKWKNKEKPQQSVCSYFIQRLTMCLNLLEKVVSLLLHRAKVVQGLLLHIFCSTMYVFINIYLFIFTLLVQPSWNPISPWINKVFCLSYLFSFDHS